MNEVEKVHGVLVEHSIVRGIRSLQTHCKCGWISKSKADGWHEHTQHQAVELVAARRRVRANEMQNERRRQREGGVA